MHQQVFCVLSNAELDALVAAHINDCGWQSRRCYGWQLGHTFTYTKLTGRLNEFDRARLNRFSLETDGSKAYLYSDIVLNTLIQAGALDATNVIVRCEA